jgi:nicotinamide mononucleotide adenylyltransferase
MNKELFKLFLVLFRKKKKNPEEFVSQVLIKYQHELVDSIFDKLNESTKKLPTYEQFTSMLSEDIEEYYETENIIINEITAKLNEEKIVDNLDAMKLVAFWQEAFSFNSLKYNIPKKDINIAIGNFQPMHIGVYNQIIKMREKTKTKFVLVQIHDGKTSNVRPISYRTSNDCLSEFLSVKDDVFVDVVQIDIMEFKKILRLLQNKNYNVKKILCSQKISQDLQHQLDYLFFENEYYICPSIKIVEYNKYEINSQELTSNLIIKTIINNDYMKFKTLVPEVLLTSFEKMRQEVNKTAITYDI